MEIRIGRREDIPALLDIYNYEVLNGVATLDLQKKTMEEWTVWFENHNKGNHPLYVALQDGVAVGYATLSSYREKEAFRSTVELSIYVAKEARGKGVATALLETILAYARKDENTHSVVSVITSGNEASTHLHRKFGFQFAGTIREVGFKKGKYQDIDNFYLLV